MTDLVLQIRHGGLGDHLFHSHLPRIAKESGAYTRVFYSKLSVIRSPEIARVVWQANPFLDGFVDSPGPDVRSRIRAQPTGNLLDAVMLAYGIDDGQRYHEPELFVTPRLDSSLAATAIYDPNYVSFVGAVDAHLITEHLNREQQKADLKQIEPRARSYALPSVVPKIRTQSLEDYCALIMSCGKFYCLTSGSATLAAGLRKSSTVFYGYGQDPVFRHSKQHTYVLASRGDITARVSAAVLRMRRKLLPRQ